VFIEECYLERFHRERPVNVISIEDRYRAKRAPHEARMRAKKIARKLAKKKRRLQRLHGGETLVLEQHGGTESVDHGQPHSEDIPF
jgi:hypothetical protein